jgi:hypothetical protein
MLRSIQAINKFRGVTSRHWRASRSLSSQQFPSVKKIEITNNYDDVSLEIQSHWQDYCEISSTPSSLPVMVSVSDSGEGDNSSLNVEIEDSSTPEDRKVLRVLVPEMMDMTIQGSFKEIKFENKVMSMTLIALV